METLEVLLRRAKLQWFGYVHRMDYNRTPRKH